MLTYTLQLLLAKVIFHEGRSLLAEQVHEVLLAVENGHTVWAAVMAEMWSLPFLACLIRKSYNVLEIY
jgi:hypothetical protein